MSKICPNCGSDVPETSAFCTKCGASCGTAPAASASKPAEILDKGKAVAADLANRVKSIDVNEVAKQAKANPVKFIVPAVAVVAVVVLLIVLLGGSGYTKAIDNMIDFTFKGKVAKFESLAPAAFWEYIEEEYDADLDDIKDDLEDMMEDALDDLEDEYGNHVKIKYEVKKEKELSEKKLKKLAEALDDTYDIDSKSVKAAYDLKVEMSIEGDDDDDEQDMEMTVVKIGGNWYIVSYYEYDDEYSVRFYAENFA